MTSDLSKLHAMLHEDTGAKGTNEFGKVARADGPVVTTQARDRHFTAK